MHLHTKNDVKDFESRHVVYMYIYLDRSMTVHGSLCRTYDIVATPPVKQITYKPTPVQIYTISL